MKNGGKNSESGRQKINNTGLERQNSLMQLWERRSDPTMDLIKRRAEVDVRTEKAENKPKSVADLMAEADTLRRCSCDDKNSKKERYKYLIKAINKYLDAYDAAGRYSVEEAVIKGRAEIKKVIDKIGEVYPAEGKKIALVLELKENGQLFFFEPEKAKPVFGNYTAAEALRPQVNHASQLNIK